MKAAILIPWTCLLWLVLAPAEGRAIEPAPAVPPSTASHSPGPDAAVPVPASDPLLAFLEAKILSNEGRWAEASQAFEQASDVVDEPYVHIEYARMLLRLAQFSRPEARRARLDEAATEAEAALRSAPGNLDVLRVLAEVRIEQSAVDPAAIPLARQAMLALLAASPSDLQAALTAAQLALVSREPAEALRILDAARASRPRNPALADAVVEALRHSARASARGPAADAAFEAALRERLTAEPEVLEFRLALVDHELDHLDPDAAIAVLTAAPSEQQTEPDFLRRLAMSRYRDAEPEAALATLEGAGQGLPDPGAALGASERALFLLSIPDFEKAALELEAVLADAPDAPPGPGPDRVGRTGSRPETVALLARALVGQGRFDEAARRVDAAADEWAGERLAPFAAEVRLRFATTLALAGEWERVLAALAPWLRAQGAPGSASSAPPGAARDSAGSSTEAAQGNPAARARALDLAAQAWLERGEPARAAALFGTEDREPEMVARRAEALWRVGDRSAARTSLASLAEGDDDSLLAAGEAWQRLERFDDAVVAARLLLGRSKRSLPGRYLLATSLERDGQIAAAVEELRALLADHPEFAPALNYLGYVFAERRQHLDEAVQLTRKAVAADPDNAAYLDSLAWALFGRGDVDRAARLLERAVALETRDATLWEHVGDVRSARGDLAGARRAYEASLALEPDEPRAVRRKLQRLPE